jgi:hypothetical protein
MKCRTQIAALLTLVIVVLNSRASGSLLPISGVAPAEDSLAELKKNYPLVYNHLVLEFKSAASFNYSVEGNVVLISFTNNSQKILAVYSTEGEFRHSITDIGLAIPNPITEQLKKEYPDFSIYYGREIRVNDKNMYQVVIENKYEYRLINFIDAEMEEVKRLKK